ncbi:M15 family metallopeptidase [Nocardioides renjunii]|uniref:M15 family metallopeptidase n=1 Tax=Nocardioides renjunii TaxID=3095075 RepID=UPI002AFFED9C|nr:M15 family metallopeptidase [Nocardioides sp. S-34]WQQ22768.1 M15 family metallopeptidase [Nocardioides sp. S-34]
MTTIRRTRLTLTVLVLALLTLGCYASEGGEDALRTAEAVVTGRTDVDSLAPDDAALARLDPELLAAVRRATRDAERDGVRLTITSGWRSRAHQERLLAEAVEQYGSLEEASRWVATPDASAHVTGDAVDIGPTDGAIWVGRHGAAYGLCQVFANEPWHFELLTTPGGPCPPMLPDGSAPRMPRPR